CLQHDSFPLTF
nr:immunoglobulin light chain junction region [Macaca mulatta]MOY11117.1 immunoglobulin light chain junction region [Macaca mulatta]MOY11225.1 immunoglobulin light chain junction region [Macaca mulatta]MOY11602.1 immunoglobulin light chain junction region [Macaca mulatta]MOY12800.1 immunoglobulin light chain junction region [Macaca mulatta]